MAARSRPRFRSLILLLSVVAAIVGLVLIRHIRDGVPPPPRDLFPTGELRVGIDPSNPPFACRHRQRFVRFRHRPRPRTRQAARFACAIRLSRL